MIKLMMIKYFSSYDMRREEDVRLSVLAESVPQCVPSCVPQVSFKSGVLKSKNTILSYIVEQWNRWNRYYSVYIYIHSLTVTESISLLLRQRSIAGDQSPICSTP